jgi:hypothetical protein
MILVIILEEINKKAANGLIHPDQLRARFHPADKPYAPLTFKVDPAFIQKFFTVPDPSPQAKEIEQLIFVRFEELKNIKVEIEGEGEKQREKYLATARDAKNVSHSISLTSSTGLFLTHPDTSARISNSSFENYKKSSESAINAFKLEEDAYWKLKNEGKLPSQGWVAIRGDQLVAQGATLPERYPKS